MKINNNVDGVLGFRTNLNLYLINNDSKRKELGIKAEDEEEVEGVTGDEEVDGEADVGLSPNIDFAILDLNSKVTNTVYRKDEVEWIIVIFRE
uniref:Uncharacterized protein n=1 Tax=Vespula pensylvanica TaxID=30213 RepID=A0A834MYV5_VESPE|nr:hypothetical protein H0235_017582 [Vespula pensylvanica]